MSREIHIRFSFGDLSYLLQCFACSWRHRTLRCARRGLRDVWNVLRGREQSWDAFTIGDWVELRRWRAWAARDHERDPTPTPWRHDRAAPPLAQHRLPQLPSHPPLPEAAFEARVCRVLILPGLTLLCLALALLAGTLLVVGLYYLAGCIVVWAAGMATWVLRYTGHLG